MMPVRIRELDASGWRTIVAADNAGTGRDALIYGTYRPGPTTAGAFPTSSRTQSTGETIATSGLTISRRDYWGEVIVNAPGLVFRDCVFRGDGVTRMVRASAGNDFKGARFVDCTFDGTGREGVHVDALHGGNFTLERCEIKRVSDGVGLTTTFGNVSILGCWIHDSSVFAWEPGTAGMPGYSDYRTHNDGIQFHIGSDYVVRGNYIGGLRKNYSKSDPTQDPSIPDSADDFDNAAILIQQEVSTAAENKLRNILIEKNWFHGGAATLNLGYKFGNALDDNVVIRDNRFMRRISPDGGFYVYKSTSVSPTLDGNVFDDDGTAVTVNTY